jgi:hypothetical protein
LNTLSHVSSSPVVAERTPPMRPRAN